MTDLMNAKPSLARDRARKMMEPQVMGLNGAAPVTPPKTNTIAQASDKANMRPIAFKDGGAVNQKVTSGVHQHERNMHAGKKETKLKLARGGRPHSAKQTSKPTAAGPRVGKEPKTMAQKFALGGAAKLRKNVATKDGAINKNAVPRNKAGRGGIM